MSFRGRFRFGIKTLLLAVALVCSALAMISQPIVDERRQQELLHQAAALGGRTSNLGTVERGRSLARFILAMFEASYDRFRLVGLDFSGTNIKDADLALLAQIRHIKELNLSNTQISDAGLAHLEKLEYLTKLDLGGTWVTDKGMTHLRGLDILASLRVVGTSVSHEALQALEAKLPYAHFREEKAIEELKSAGIQVVGTPRLIDGNPARGCWVLQAGSEADFVIVGMNRKITLTKQDVDNLGFLQSVREMTFHTVNLGPQGLAELKPLEKLETLEFWFVNLSDKDLASIGRQTKLQALTIEDADGITDAGLSHLESLRDLKTLRISGCARISQPAVSALERALPNRRVEFSKN